MGDHYEIEAFATRVLHKGPQWVTVEGKPYRCLTPVRDSQTQYIATTSGDYRVFTLNPFVRTAEVITVDNPFQGEVMAPLWHVRLETIVQTVAEAWVNDNSPGFEYYAHYLVVVMVAGQLILADELSAALLQRTCLEAGSEMKDVIQNLQCYRQDQVGSGRLRAAWVGGIVGLARGSVYQ